MIPQISDAEWQIMKLLWQNAPQSANDLMEKLSDTMQWTAQTVKTLLGRLVKKGAIDYHKESRAFHYFPLVTEDEYLQHQRKSFLSRMYDGAVKPLIAGFLEDQQLSSEEIAELKRILEKKKSDHE